MAIAYDALRRRPGLSAVVLLGLLQGSCADARGRFEDYRNRLARADAGIADASGACVPPDPGTVFGPALLAIDTSLTSGQPILFLGRIDTPSIDGKTAVHFRYRALDARDRKTRVGDELEVGPYALQGAELIAHVPKSTLDGQADPIVYGEPITSEMTLTGQICGVRPIYCGTLMGKTTGYVEGPFTGDFAITLLDSDDAVPTRPRFGCASDQLAPALPP